MGLPIARLAGRAGFIAAMIAGGVLAAGIAQAQAQTLPSPAEAATAAPAPSDVPRPSDGRFGEDPPSPADRQAELIAAGGCPARAARLMAVAPERPAVEVRADDVEDAEPAPIQAPDATRVAAPRTR